MALFTPGVGKAKKGNTLYVKNEFINYYVPICPHIIAFIYIA